MEVEWNCPKCGAGNGGDDSHLKHFTVTCDECGQQCLVRCPTSVDAEEVAIVEDSE